MINFIICDSNLTYQEITKNIISDTMIENNLNYRIHTFKDYNEELKNIINDNKTSNKIYILDIPFGDEYSGMDVAEDIRCIDFESLIIFYSSFKENFYNLMKLRLLIFDYINKSNKTKLKETLNAAIEIINRKRNIDFIEIKSNHILYKIKLDDILCIMTSTENRGVIIKTKYDEIHVNKSLSEVRGILDDRFLRTHRACFVNKDHIKYIDFRYRYIYLDDGESLGLVSIRELKNLKKHLIN